MVLTTMVGYTLKSGTVQWSVTGRDLGCQMNASAQFSLAGDSYDTLGQPSGNINITTSTSPMRYGVLGTYGKTVTIPCPHDTKVPYHPFQSWLSTSKAQRIITVNPNGTLTGTTTAQTGWAYIGESQATVTYTWRLMPQR